MSRFTTVVTGGGSGLGLVTARRLIKAGQDVIAKGSVDTWRVDDRPVGTRQWVVSVISGALGAFFRAGASPAAAAVEGMTSTSATRSSGVMALTRGTSAIRQPRPWVMS